MLAVACASLALTAAPRPIVTLPVAALTLTGGRTSVPLDVGRVRARLLAVSRSSGRTLFLKLGRVQAPRRPGVVWNVYLSSSAGGTPRAALVGTVSLYSAGIRAPTSFLFPADAAVERALVRGNGRVLRLTFVPRGPLIDGKPSRPRPAAAVDVGRIGFVEQSG